MCRPVEFWLSRPESVQQCVKRLDTLVSSDVLNGRVGNEYRGFLCSGEKHPGLIDPIAQHHHVVAFDNRGVGASTGTVPGTVEAMADDAHTFITALGCIQAAQTGRKRARAAGISTSIHDDMHAGELETSVLLAAHAS